MARTTLYICADSTLTYGPYGGRRKIIKQALPLGFVESPEKAEELISLVGRKAYDDPRADPQYRTSLRGREIEPGYGPAWRHYYSGPEFVLDDWRTIEAVAEALSEHGLEPAW